ncbi:MAG: YihY/virulence factor BrkB family protein [Anaerotignum sp.]|nr:YihY/virulence factor BrkB family protein [Anaerotignum sp.]
MQKAKTILQLTIKGFLGKEVGKRSAGLTYYLVFAIFPFIISIISILGILHLPMISLDGDAAAFLPKDIITLLNITLVHMTTYSNGAILTFGLAFALWFPFRAVKNMTEEVADIYGDEKMKVKGHLARVFFLYIIILIFIPVMFILLIVGEGVLDFVAQFLPIITMEFISLWNKLRFLPMALALILLTSAVYALSPAKRPGWHYVLPGALLSTGAWMVYSLFFAHYVNNMGNYSVIYGSIGAIIAFLIWLNWSLTALLTGAVFNQALREAKKEDLSEKAA